jgi:D-amino-acid dehydrogenase
LSIQLGERIQAHPSFKGLIHAQALGFGVEGGRAVALRTTQGDLVGDEFVIAAGLHSRALARAVGIELPIYPLKGYSLSAPIGNDHLPPVVSVTDVEKKILYTRIGSELRVAAMADLVGDDATIDPARIASLHRSVRATLPMAAEFAQSKEWAGLRPATPSGAPILGATPMPGLWLNVGHGALGFTLAFGSAQVLADLVCGRPSPLPLDGLQLA